MVAIGVGGKGGWGGGWTRKHLFLIKWAIINEAFFIYWHEFMVAFKDGTPSYLHNATFMAFH